MEEKRKKERRKKNKKVKTEKRKGPRRLICECGGKVEVKVLKNGNHKFTCARCRKPVK